VVEGRGEAELGMKIITITIRFEEVLPGSGVTVLNPIKWFKLQSTRLVEFVLGLNPMWVIIYIYLSLALILF